MSFGSLSLLRRGATLVHRIGRLAGLAVARAAAAQAAQIVDIAEFVDELVDVDDLGLARVERLAHGDIRVVRVHFTNPLFVLLKGEFA